MFQWIRIFKNFTKADIYKKLVLISKDFNLNIIIKRKPKFIIFCSRT